MPQLQVTTKEAQQIWASPDGQRAIYKLTLDYNGQPVTAKTYSKVIATEGWSGTVETYEKEGKGDRPSETFVKQPAKEGGYSGGRQPRDDAAIKAQMAVKAAVHLMASQEKKPKDIIAGIEQYAQELFLMVDRVKTVKEATFVDKAEEPAAETEPAAEPNEGPLDLSTIDEVFGKGEGG